MPPTVSMSPRSRAPLGRGPGHGPLSVGASGRAIKGGELATRCASSPSRATCWGPSAVRAVGSSPRWVPFGGSVARPPAVGEMAIGGA